MNLLAYINMDIEYLQTYYRVNETSNAFCCFILLQSLGKYEGLFTKHTRLFQNALADVKTQTEIASWQSADRILMFLIFVSKQT